MTRRLALIALVAPPAVAAADPPATAPVDKSAYTLFHPVPDDQQRAFNPDRPSITTGPFTIDAGHLQVESSFVQYTANQPADRGGPGGSALSVLPTEFRLGVLDRVEVDLTVNPFLYQRTPAAMPGHADGFGDLQLQAKLNLFGDDGGDLAFGIIPYVTLPTASSSRGLGTGRFAGGVLLPVQINLPADFVLAGQVEFDLPRNAADTGTGSDVMQTAVLSHPLLGQLNGYVEYVGVAPISLGQSFTATANVGLTYGVTDTVQLDVAIDVGLSRDAPPYTLLTGITVRR